MCYKFASTVLAAGALSANLAQAQAPAAPPPAAVAPMTSPAIPDAMPFNIPYGASMGIDMAHKTIAAAAADAKRRNWKMAISVVDPAGHLIAHVTMDDTQYGSIPIAQAKAHTSAVLRRPSKALADAINGGSPATLSLIGLFDGAASEGGLPIVVDGKLVGAIGVSGGTGGQDGVIAKVGLDAAIAK